MTQFRRLLIIGKTGNGKSTVGNIILGDNKFQVKAGMAPKPGMPLPEHTVRNKRFTELRVILGDDILNLTHNEHTRRQELESWRKIDPHAVLLAIRCDGRYTHEEFELYRMMKEFWPEVTQRLVVAFTFGENCADIESELDHASPELLEVLRDASGRYCVFGKRQQLVEKSRHGYELHSIVDHMAPVTGMPSEASARSYIASASAMTSSDTSRETNPFRILIIGMWGSGKSTMGNILLGEDKFSERPFVTHQTEKKHQVAETIWNNFRRIQVIHTPDFDSISQNPQIVQAEVMRWKEDLNGQDPDAILLCIRIDRRRSDADYQQYLRFLKILGYEESVLQGCLTIAFESSNWELFKQDLQNRKSLQELTRTTHNRYVVFKGSNTGEELRQQKELVLSKLLHFQDHWIAPKKHF